MTITLATEAGLGPAGGGGIILVTSKCVDGRRGWVNGRTQTRRRCDGSGSQHRPTRAWQVGMVSLDGTDPAVRWQSAPGAGGSTLRRPGALTHERVGRWGKT